MYDWLRLDLDGRPRPLNIARGMDNLNFERCGDVVAETLIVHPLLLVQDCDFSLYHLPTHHDHLYDIHRYLIHREVTINTDFKVHVLSLVEGERIEILIDEDSLLFAYAETVVIPAAVKKYTIRNRSKSSAIVIKAFLK